MPLQKHILFISSWYPNKTNPTHGIFNKEFAKAVSLTNKVSVLHIVSVTHIKTDYEIENFTEDNILHVIIYYKKINNNSYFGKYNKIKTTNALYETGFKLIAEKNTKPHLIHLNIAMPAGIGVLHLSKKLNLPYVLNEGWSGYMKEDGSYKGFFQKYFTKKIIKSAKVVMPVSNSLKEAMLLHNLNGNYVIVPNVVNTDSFKAIKNNTSSHSIKFLHISTLDEKQKNVSGIIKSFAQVVKEFDFITLTIIGSEEKMGELKLIAKNLCIENKIIFKGVLTQHQINEEYNSHSALIMFSNYETFCLVVAEALACELPVITSNCGGLTTSLPNNFCEKVPPNDTDALVKAMKNFCLNKINTNKKDAKTFIENNFNCKIISEQLTAIYTNILTNA